MLIQFKKKRIEQAGKRLVRTAYKNVTPWNKRVAMRQCVQKIPQYFTLY